MVERDGVGVMRILFLILLLSIYSFGQENRLVRQNELSDSLNTLRNLIGTGGVALPDSVIFPTDTTAQRTFSDLKYVDKTTAQTITGQKNFSGTVKVGSDTSMILGYMDGSYRTGIYINQLAGHPYGFNKIFKVKPLDAYTADWSMTSGMTDFIDTLDGVDHTLNIAANNFGDLQVPQFGMQFEHNYEFADSGSAMEWFLWYNDLPSPNTDYSVRPIQLGIEQYESGRHYTSFSYSVDRLFIGGTDALDDRFDFQPKSTAFAGKLGAFFMNDSSWMKNNVNNFGWLYQMSNDNSSIELMRVDDNNRVLISPSTTNYIDFGSPIYGTIDWRNEANTDVVSIYKETGTDRIFVGGTDGMVTNQLEVTVIPQDTFMLDAGKFYIDDLTGSVQYTMPENLVTNGTFTAWTGAGKAATPDGWTFAPDPRDTTAIYVEQSPTGKAHYVWDGSSINHYLLQATSSIGTNYGYSFEVSAITDSAKVYIVGVPIVITSTGVYSGSCESVANEKFKIIPFYGAGSITLDNMRLWEIGGNIDAPTYDVPVILDSLGLAVAPVIDTTGVTDGYVLKYLGGSIVYSPDVSTSGSGTFNPDGVTIDTTAGGLARVLPAKVTKWDSVTYKQNRDTDLDNPDIPLNVLQDSLTAKANTAWFAIAPALIDDSITVKMNRSEMAGYATASHTHTEFYDTLAFNISVPDTVIAGDNVIFKIPNNITITEVSAFTNSGTVTFNVEERGETTPNTAGTDVMTSDLVADTDQQETSTFSNSGIARDAYLAISVTSITGDPTLFGVHIRYIKQ